MKSHWIELIIICMLAISAGAQVNSGSQPAVGPFTSSTAQADGTDKAPSQLGSSQDPAPYPERLESVLTAMSAELGEIAQAARDGKITRAQAEYLSLERYYVALTRFQFLRTLYESPEENDLRAPYSQANTVTQTASGVLAIPAVTCTPEIPAQIVDYLELTPVEMQALEAEVTEECKQVKPLVEKLENSRRRLMAMKLDGKAGDREVQTIAAEQSQIMKQLIVANSQLETKLYSLLTTEQQRKVDGLLRQTLSLHEQLPSE